MAKVKANLNRASLAEAVLLEVANINGVSPASEVALQRAFDIVNDLDYSEDKKLSVRTEIELAWTRQCVSNATPVSEQTLKDLILALMNS